jgi:hypothetical protein
LREMGEERLLLRARSGLSESNGDSGAG